MIEGLARTIEFPAFRDVARLASAVELGFLKSAAMRVHVTVLATAEHESLEKSRLSLGMRLMALPAGDRLVLPGEGVVRAAVIEAGSGRPGILRMAACAVRSLLSFVHISVARKALAAKTEKRMVEILDLDVRAGGGRNKLAHVALLAGKGLMLPFQRHTSFGGVIEALTVQSHQGEFRAVMLRVTAHAVRLAGGTLVLAGMITGMSIQPVPDLNVTFEALKAAVSSARSEIVT
jgi:hypothetical protein